MAFSQTPPWSVETVIPVVGHGGLALFPNLDFSALKALEAASLAVFGKVASFGYLGHRFLNEKNKEKRIRSYSQCCLRYFTVSVTCVFNHAHVTLYEGLFVRWSVRPSVGRSVLLFC